MTIVEFLEARIAEVEAHPYCGGCGEYMDCDQWMEQRLAECAVKRKILAMYDNEPCPDPCHNETVYQVIMVLASVYSGHADYQQEWA